MVAFSQRLIPNIQADTSGSEGVEKEKWLREHFTAQQRKKEEPEALELYLCEPWAVDVKTNEPFLPHWLFFQVANENPGVVVP